MISLSNPKTNWFPDDVMNIVHRSHLIFRLSSAYYIQFYTWALRVATFRAINQRLNKYEKIDTLRIWNCFFVFEGIINLTWNKTSPNLACDSCKCACKTPYTNTQQTSTIDRVRLKWEAVGGPTSIYLPHIHMCFSTSFSLRY